jgi:hypothetical protein
MRVTKDTLKQALDGRELQTGVRAEGKHREKPNYQLPVSTHCLPLGTKLPSTANAADANRPPDLQAPITIEIEAQLAQLRAGRF